MEKVIALRDNQVDPVSIKTPMPVIHHPTQLLNQDRTSVMFNLPHFSKHGYNYQGECLEQLVCRNYLYITNWE